MTPEKQYRYSQNEEDFYEWQELLEQYWHNDPVIGDTYWEVEVKPSDPTVGINQFTVQKLLENLDETAGEFFEYFESYRSVPEEAQTELGELLKAWATKHVNLAHYWEHVGEPVEKKFTKEDLE